MGTPLVYQVVVHLILDPRMNIRVCSIIPSSRIPPASHAAGHVNDLDKD